MRLVTLTATLLCLFACSPADRVDDAVLLATSADLSPAEEPAFEKVNLTIEIDDVNLRGRPFDGVGHIGGLFGPGLLGVTLQSPADVYICLIRLEPDPVTECNLGKDAEGRPLAPFHDARRAQFAFEIAYRAPVGVLVLDQDDVGDGKLDDNIEAFVLASPGEDPERVAVLDRALSKLLSERAATRMDVDVLGNIIPIDLDASEARRRLRGQDVIERGACGADHPCRMEQSLITISLSQS